MAASIRTARDFMLMKGKDPRRVRAPVANLPSKAAMGTWCGLTVGRASRQGFLRVHVRQTISRARVRGLRVPPRRWRAVPFSQIVLSNKRNTSIAAVHEFNEMLSPDIFEWEGRASTSDLIFVNIFAVQTGRHVCARGYSALSVSAKAGFCITALPFVIVPTLSYIRFASCSWNA